MPHASQRRRAVAEERYRRSAALMLGASALVLAALVLVPWLAARLFAWPLAPVVAVVLALPPAVHFWFRRVQRTSRRTAMLAAAGYTALAAVVVWLWRVL
ncbi:MAG TPA: hypothetical protein VFS08_03595 [Gemmatimonadaceae bacterium]|nr:hypothetical protein [Gemmatimonadaceae bacterium]